uniref:AIRE regulator n=1 Tax=Calidris pygmaea TaxID=425635 RepID=A0A8C3JUY0_9CHAR
MGDLRHLLKLHRTEIAMAVDDVFPLLHGLADHDVVPEHVFKETLSRTEREGSHRAFHALLTWLLGRDAAALRDFWDVLFKDYNLERYSRLRPLRGAFPTGKVELGRQRRGRRLSPSPTAPAPHRPQNKRKAPEEREGARVAQPSPRHTASPGMETRGVGRRWGGMLGGGCSPSGEAMGSPASMDNHGWLSVPPGGVTVTPLPAPPRPPGQENEDECAACGDGGELICCDGCPRAFHLACLVPPLPRVPSGMWRCSSCVASTTEPGRLREGDVAVERAPETPGEETCGTQRGRGDRSVCGRCYTQIPAPRHFHPTPSPASLCLKSSPGEVCVTPDGLWVRDEGGQESWTCLLPQAEDGSLGGSDPVMSRDELDALLGEVRHSGGHQQVGSIYRGK